MHRQLCRAAGSGDHATAVGLFSAIVMGLYRRERTGKGSYVTTSLLAEGVWACGVPVQAALCDAKFYPLHDRKSPPNAILNVYQTSDDNWLMLVVEPSRFAALATGIGRPDLVSDARFSDRAKMATNSAQLTAILDEAFRSQPIEHWREVLDQAWRCSSSNRSHHRPSTAGEQHRRPARGRGRTPQLYD